MGDAPPPGFYVDEGSGRERWWDGSGWTDHYKATEARGRSAIEIGQIDFARLAVAIFGAAIAIAAVFLPIAEVAASGRFGVTHSDVSLHVTGNALIHHPEGIAVIVLAALAVLVSFQGGAIWRAATFIGGLALIGLAVAAGVNPPLTKTCQLFGSRCEGLVRIDVHPGSAVWTLGVGGLILAGSALVAVRGHRG